MSEAVPAFGRTARHRTKQELAYHALRDAIMRCELLPGRRLVIDELARQLRVSAIPVREALQLLQSEGLVTNVPHMGATVSAISQQSIDEVFTLMEGLESVATRRAAERLTPEGTSELEQVVAAMDEALAISRYDEWADLNTQFHLAISRLAGMPMLLEMTERVLAHWDRVRRFYFSGVLVHRVELAQDEHRKLLRLIREKDLPALEQLVRQHNQGALRAYADFLQGRPECRDPDPSPLHAAARHASARVRPA
jgi:DNA-binding GntR family transcriptional regulator